MAFKYYDPATVTSPADFVKNIKVIYDGGADDVSAAIIDWDGKNCLAIRWNVARREWDDTEKAKGRKICVGMPSSHGYPVWFIIPSDLLDKDSDLFEKVNQFRNQLS